MWSYRSDGARIPKPRDPGLQSQNLSTPTPSSMASLAPSRLAILDKASVAQSARSQPARTSNLPLRTGRSASFSVAEETRSIPAASRSSRAFSSSDARPSLLPRVSSQSTIPVSAAQNRPPAARPAPLNRSMQNIQTPPLSSSTGSGVPTWRSSNSKPTTPTERPRNVLRRKAPTIGQQAHETEKLRLEIPDPIQRQNGTPDPETLPKMPSRQMKSNIPTAPERIMKEPERPVVQAPKELASLRTTATINTQNLPPPTPNFPSASSPSTRYSESPGIWSRGSTPTSLSSYSPGIVHSAKVGYRFRQASASPSQTRLPTASPSIKSATFRATPPIKHAEQPLSPRSTEPQGGFAKETDPIRKPIVPPPSFPPRQSSIKKASLDKSRVSAEGEQRQTHQEAEKVARQGLDTAQVGNLSESGFKPTDSAKSPPPVRPSRQGTHRLELQPSPVIQSNLASLKVTGHKRRESAESAILVDRPNPTPFSSAAASVDSIPSRNISRIPARVAPPPAAMRKSPRTLVKEPRETPETKPTTTSKRFGLFSKKSKPDLNDTSESSKSARKGPAAGTGHEGYGRYGQRGRRPSGGNNGASSGGGRESSSGPRARSSSTTRSAPQSVASSKGSVRSRQDNLDIDDFLLDRLEPVVIHGGGLSESCLPRTQSEQSMSNLSLASSFSVKGPTSQLKRDYSTDSLLTSTDPVGEKAQSKGSFQSDITLSPERSHASRTPATTSSNLASSHAPTPTAEPDKAYPFPIDADPARSRPSLSSHGSSSHGSNITSLPQIKDATVTSPRQHSRQDSLPRATSPKKSAKKGKGMRWNFFHRNHATEERKDMTNRPPPLQSTSHVHAGISPSVSDRPVAHYALIDVESDTLEDIMQRIEDSPPTDEDGKDLPVEIPTALKLKKPHGHSVLLPSPPKLHGEFSSDGRSSPKVFFNRPNYSSSRLDQSPEQQQQQQQHASRLASVGRIPRVVSRRDRQHKPALQSFSRPFSVVEGTAPLTASATQAPASPGFYSPGGLSFSPPSSTIGNVLDFIAGPYSKNEFLTFSPRKDSAMSSSSGSGSLAAVTAVVPEPGSPPTEDEVWKEYDDLIDRVLSPEVVGGTSGVDMGRDNTDEKFELATMASKTLQAELNAGPNVSNSTSTSTFNSNTTTIFSSNNTLPFPAEQQPAVVLTPASVRSSGGQSSFHLRRSQIVSALHSSLGLSTQPSYTSLIAGYGDIETPVETPRLSAADASATSAMSSASNLLDLPSLDPTLSFETSRQRNTILFDLAHRDRDGTIAQTNIRTGSLMTSRWLSFGRVLFSPAHNHVQSTDRERILVIDGLGNDDWSFYCALTYPTADVYLLQVGPAPGLSGPSSAGPSYSNPAAWPPPENHNTIQHPSLESPFPFARESFAVAVLRFPAACPESAYQNVIYECKRVLRTGGYLEMSLLDLDLVKMGIRTRKAVRSLKEKTYMADAHISLKPVSDSIQRLLGRHGFDNLRRCMVRIPAAGVITGSSDSSSSNQSISVATASATATGTPSTGHSPFASSESHTKSSSKGTELSLGDLIWDPPSPSSDESIARMVAKVARWWYTRCYEIPVLRDGDINSSIWADKKVLRECQKQGTGFRFVIAYAQKPSEPRRRTASV